MERKDYGKARSLLDTIDTTGSHAEIIKEQWSAFVNNGGNAKLYVYVAGKTYETQLSEEVLIVTLSEILKRYRNTIENARNKLNEIITQNMPVEHETLAETNDHKD